MRIDYYRPSKCQGTIKTGLLYLLYICLGVCACLAGVPTSSAVTVFDRIRLHLSMHLFGECQGTPRGNQTEGEFGVASSLVWLES